MKYAELPLHRSQGAGALLAGVLGGRLLDWQFRRTKQELNFQPKHHRDIEGFPIETVRFRFLPYYLPVYVAALLGFAWSLQTRTSVAVSIAMSFIIGLLSQFNTQCCSVCLIDMIPMRSGAAVASVRLLLARSTTGSVRLGYVYRLTHLYSITSSDAHCRPLSLR